MPAQGAQSTPTPGSYVVSVPLTQPQSSATPGSGQRPAEVSDTAAKIIPCSTPAPTMQLLSDLSGTSKVIVAMDCLASSRKPTILEVLKLMDADEPTLKRKYADAHSELCNHGITNIMDVYTYLVE